MDCVSTCSLVNSFVICSTCLKMCSLETGGTAASGIHEERWNRVGVCRRARPLVEARHRCVSRGLIKLNALCSGFLRSRSLARHIWPSWEHVSLSGQILCPPPIFFDSLFLSQLFDDLARLLLDSLPERGEVTVGRN